MRRRRRRRRRKKKKKKTKKKKQHSPAAGGVCCCSCSRLRCSPVVQIEVASLRHRFFPSIAPGGLAGDRRGVVPASVFSFSAQEIWKTIKENKDLDLPAHKVMVANVRCEDIANKKFAEFAGDKDWRELEEAAQVGAVGNFGKQLSSLLDKCLSGYDMEATYFDDAVRTAKQEQLESKLLQLVHPAFQSVLRHLSSKALNDCKASLDNAHERGEDVAAPGYINSFMTSFDKGSKDAAIAQAKWDSSEVRELLYHKMRGMVQLFLLGKQPELASKCEELQKALNKANSAQIACRLRENLVRCKSISFDRAKAWSSFRRLVPMRQELKHIYRT